MEDIIILCAVAALIAAWLFYTSLCNRASIGCLILFACCVGCILYLQVLPMKCIHDYGEQIASVNGTIISTPNKIDIVVYGPAVIRTKKMAPFFPSVRQKTVYEIYIPKKEENTK